MLLDFRQPALYSSEIQGNLVSMKKRSVAGVGWGGGASLKKTDKQIKRDLVLKAKKRLNDRQLKKNSVMKKRSLIYLKICLEQSHRLWEQ